MWIGKQNKNPALVLTRFLCLGALGVTQNKVRAAWIFQLSLLQALIWRVKRSAYRINRAIAPG